MSINSQHVGTGHNFPHYGKGCPWEDHKPHIKTITNMSQGDNAPVPKRYQGQAGIIHPSPKCNQKTRPGNTLRSTQGRYRKSRKPFWLRGGSSSSSESSSVGSQTGFRRPCLQDPLSVLNQVQPEDSMSILFQSRARHGLFVLLLYCQCCCLA